MKVSAGLQGINYVFGKTYPGESVGYNIENWGGKIVFELPTYDTKTGESAYLFSNAFIDDGNWHHNSLTNNGNQIKLYIDGLFDSSKNLSLAWTGSNAPFIIGSTILNPGQYPLNGQLDEVRFWNKTLTQEEIQANIYNEIEPQEGLVGYWKFNEGSGGIAHDSSGNGNDGILINGPTWTTDTPF